MLRLLCVGLRSVSVVFICCFVRGSVGIVGSVRAVCVFTVCGICIFICIVCAVSLFLEIVGKSLSVGNVLIVAVVACFDGVSAEYGNLVGNGFKRAPVLNCVS